MRSVVDLPQPEGPTSTTNSLSGMSRLMLRTASTLSKRFTTLRNATSAIVPIPFSALGGARSQAGDIVIHEEGVDHERRGGGKKRSGHQHAPLVNVRANEARHGADRENLFARGVQKSHRIDELGPGHGESEDRGGDDAGQRHWNEDFRQHLEMPGAVDQS